MSDKTAATIIEKINSGVYCDFNRKTNKNPMRYDKRTGTRKLQTRLQVGYSFGVSMPVFETRFFAQISIATVFPKPEVTQD